MVNANTRRFFVSDNPAIFIRLFLLTNQRQGEVESASFSFFREEIQLLSRRLLADPAYSRSLRRKCIFDHAVSLFLGLTISDRVFSGIRSSEIYILMFFQFSHIMKKGRTYGMILFLSSNIHYMGNHGTEYCHIQGMSGNIIFQASQILIKINLLIQMSVVADNHIRNRLDPALFSGLQNAIQLFFDRTDRLDLEPFKFQILLRHGR